MITFLCYRYSSNLCVTSKTPVNDQTLLKFFVSTVLFLLRKGFNRSVIFSLYFENIFFFCLENTDIFFNTIVSM